MHYTTSIREATTKKFENPGVAAQIYPPPDYTVKVILGYPDHTFRA